MQQRLPSLLHSPWLFAHRGARAYERENTLAAFNLAIKLGATGLESDVWLTRDRIAVLNHDGVVGPRWRRRAISDLTQSELPMDTPKLAELAEIAARHKVALSLDVKDPGAYEIIVKTLAEVSPKLLQSTYICCEDYDLLTEIAPRFREVLLVDSSRLAKMKHGPERRLAQLHEIGVTALNMHHSDWNGGLVTLAHRFERLAFAWDAQFEHQLSGLLRMGIDGIFSDWVDRMVDAAAKESEFEQD